MLLLIAAGPALLTAWFHPQPVVWSWHRPSLTHVNLAEIARWNSPVLWVDARETAAFQQDHIPGAVLLNETEWDRLLPGFLEKWQPEMRVVVYCGSEACNASEDAANRLKRELELKDIFVLEGGWAAWQSAPRP
jgi:rhodanese-related sulfurtransferase